LFKPMSGSPAFSVPIIGTWIHVGMSPKARIGKECHAWIDNYCRQNPTIRVYVAVMSLIDHLRAR
jgi:hypothetical protein